jgi:DNA-binding CsgD family transcriptional regulator
VISESIDRGDVGMALSELLEMIGIPALLLDRRGLVIAASELARSSLGNELQIVNERLVSPDAAAQAAVNRLVKCVAYSEPRSSPRAISIHRKNDLPIIMYGFKLTNSALESFDPAHTVLVLVEPRSKLLPAESQLKDAFDLSWMEAKLALRLAKGDTLDAAATRCRVTYESARSLIKSAYQKTETHRQAELVALIYSIVPVPRLVTSLADSVALCDRANQNEIGPSTL